MELRAMTAPTEISFEARPRSGAHAMVGGSGNTGAAEAIVTPPTIDQTPEQEVERISRVFASSDLKPKVLHLAYMTHRRARWPKS